MYLTDEWARPKTWRADLMRDALRHAVAIRFALG